MLNTSYERQDSMILTEEWKQIAKYPEYAVSNHGYVMRLTEGNTYKALEIVMPHMLSVGYLAVNLFPSQDVGYVHRLVIETFFGPCPDGYECHHIDGDKLNNRLDNLEWISKLEHIKTNMNLCPKTGSNNPMAKLLEEDIRNILRLLGEGMQGKAVAELYGLSQATISMIKNGRRWANAQPKERIHNEEAPLQ
jgi:hypothetical protein